MRSEACSLNEHKTLPLLDLKNLSMHVLLGRFSLKTESKIEC